MSALNSDLVFHKYQGCGNDFIIVDASSKNSAELISTLSKKAPRLCDRNFAIGADGILVLEDAGRHWQMTVINADGSLGKNCGNGLRCAASFIAREHGPSSIDIKIGDRHFPCQVKSDVISVHMGELSIDHQRQVTVGGDKTFDVFESVIGNKHLVLWSETPINVDEKLVSEVKEIVDHSADINIGFAYWSDDKIFSQVYEAGVGFTKACGSGACAALAAYYLKMRCQGTQEILVEQSGGEILVTLNASPQKGSKTWLDVEQSGPARECFRGICADYLNC